MGLKSNDNIPETMAQRQDILSSAWRTLSWALYDFANTIFSMNVITLYFALWVTVDKNGRDILYSLVFSASMIFSAFLEPLLGAYSDSVGRKRPFIVFFTVLCCVFTALIGIFNHLVLGLIFFVVANMGYQLAAVFYTALLSKVSQQKNIGRVSGLGVGLGYVGTIAGLLMVKPFVYRSGHIGAFIPTGLLFLLFSLPCIFSIREERTQKISFKPQVIYRKSFERIQGTIQKLKEASPVRILFVAGLAFFSAVNTVILFMGVYTKKVMGFSQDEIVRFLVLSTLFAIFSAFVFGYLVDRWSAFKAFRVMLFFWICGLGVALVSLNKILFWVAGALIGVCLSATWVICRVLIVNLCPQEKLAEIFGLFGLMGKLSGIVGSFVWGTTVLVFEFLGLYKYKIAIGLQIVFVVFALWVAKRLDRYFSPGMLKKLQTSYRDA